MNHNYVRIAFLLDKSSSMTLLQPTSISGFNEYISKVKADNHGYCKFKLVQFNHQYELTCDLPISQVPDLNPATYAPDGTTAYLDAMGRTIDDLGHELNLLPESEKPGTVIICCLTDGLENASKRYTHGQVAEMIAHQQNKYNWDIVYFGANHDASQFASSLNIPQSKVVYYSASVADPEAMVGAFNAAANYTNRVRSSGVSGQSTRGVTFTEQERGASVDSHYQSPDSTTTGATTPEPTTTTTTTTNQ